ncbi:MAG: hypothetical protein WCF85_12695 [Rhodospirillaceae bacterium]
MITPFDILSEAKTLLDLPPETRTEARRRTIIGRCYYAAYKHLHSHDVAKGYRHSPGQNTGSHRSFLNHLKESDQPDVVKAIKVLEFLLSYRVQADYFLDIEIIDSLATDCWKRANFLMTRTLPATSSA